MPLPRRVRLPAGLVAAVIAAAGLAACGGGGPKPTAVAPSWHPPAVSGSPSAATFCALLRVDYGHLRTPAGSSVRDVVGEFDGFFAAEPALVAAAPPAIHTDAAVFLDTSVNFFRAVLATDVDHTAAPAALLRELASPATAPAERAMLAWAQASCHPDPLPAPSSAVAPTTTLPVGGSPSPSTTTTTTTVLSTPPAG